MKETSDDVLNYSNLSSGKMDALSQEDRHAGYIRNLDGCSNFKEVFQIVKRSVKESLNTERVGLMLFLSDLPYNVGAYHQVGTNNIVMNRVLLDHVLEIAEDTRQANSFIYSILMHEYLHSLGYLHEEDARGLAYRISRDTFGDEHLVTRMAASNPWQYIKPPHRGMNDIQRPTSVVRDFEPPPFGIIS
ncbi:hypothetical protein MUP59_02205 [Candidatus Bathyarchaeota archaeon]|nr:hypothetical protein [Candidatus Bathyarchaeota archaeon]